MPEFSLQSIVPGVSVALGGSSNRGIISSAGHVLVIDSGMSVAEAEPLREAANGSRERGSLALFNTHHHPDHVFGNQVFGDVPILAQQAVRDTLLSGGSQMLEGIRRNPEMAARIGEVELTPPGVTFDRELTVTVGETEVRLQHFGAAHSPSDSIAWLPETRVLFTGDLLFNDIVPVLDPRGDTARWVEALRELEQMDAEFVNPGHGSIKSPAALGELRTWMMQLRERVGEAIRSGWDREETVTRVREQMQAESPRTRDERFPGVIGKVFEELGG